MADLMKVSDETLQMWADQFPVIAPAAVELLAYRRLIMPPDGPTLHDRLDAVLDELRAMADPRWDPPIVKALAAIIEDVAAVTP